VFGNPKEIVHDTSTTTPHVDIYVYAPGLAGRDYLTLVTGGMSDLPMNVPPEEQHRRKRFELVLYCSALSVEIIRYLRMIALFPSASGRWLDHGFTVRDEHDEPAFANSALVASVLVDALFDDEMKLPSQLVTDGDPVHLLLPIPITVKEHDYVVHHGIQAFFDGPLAASDYDLMCNTMRRSTVLSSYSILGERVVEQNRLTQWPLSDPLIGPASARPTGSGDPKPHLNGLRFWQSHRTRSTSEAS
jgi:hypothetical protein